eukprot:TRINITY_DN4064_c0_g1_i1.p1 TRINITY_DN4064_c0_g1~~TRINITY_DN4064_c0_g1_i1.p1  ORF type:complete len:179 (-),score=9.21 TRINITY_DN4064_c0_g1_i1:34-570(-)
MEELMDIDISDSLSQIEDPFFKMSFEFEEELTKRDSKDPNMQLAGEDGEGICKFFLKGSCMKGNDCTYRHSRAERSVVCKHWLRGQCRKGNLCEFLHRYDLTKIPECFFYSRYGECSNPRCFCLHVNYKLNPYPLESVTCFKCGQLGHYASRCSSGIVPPGGFPLSYADYGNVTDMAD